MTVEFPEGFENIEKEEEMLFGKEVADDVLLGESVVSESGGKIGKLLVKKLQNLTKDDQKITKT